VVLREVLSESLEDYLEAIYVVGGKGGPARVRDIAAHLGVIYPSVTAALRTLADLGLVRYVPYQPATLTSRGLRLAREVLRRHSVLKEFLTQVLRVKEPTADSVACRMEHAMPADVFERFVKYLELVESCRGSKVDWDQDVGFICRASLDQETCELCGFGISARVKNSASKRRKRNEIQEKRKA